MALLASSALIIAFLVSSAIAQSGMKSVNLAESRVLVDKSPYAVVLRDLGAKTNRNDLFYAFFADKQGADHMYQFNSLESLTGGRADVVWFFKENRQCVPNSAAVYNGVLFCRLWTNKYDEYSNPSVSRRAISPVTIAAFNLAGAPTARMGDMCASGAARMGAFPNATEANMMKSLDYFERLPPQNSEKINFLDKYDLAVPSASILQRPNMNVRFHVDESGMWLLAPHQFAETGNPFLRRLRIDPATLSTSQVAFPRAENFSDTTQTIMMQFGIGVMVDGFYYGLSRTGDGNIYFRQRGTRDFFSAEMGPYTTKKDNGYLLLANSGVSQYASALQYNPVFGDILFTVKDLSRPLGEQHRHVLVPIAK